MLTAPDHTQHRIYLHNTFNDRGFHVVGDFQKRNGKFAATGVVLVGYCPDNLEYFNLLYRHAKESFPELQESAIQCGRVRRSSTIQGFTLLMFDLTEILNWDRLPHPNKPYVSATGVEWPVFVNIEFEY